MVERYSRGKGKRPLLGSHQKCWIWGRHLVQETLDAGVWPIRDLFLSDQLPAADRESALRRAAALGVPATVRPPADLSLLGHTSEHQGYLARMEAFPYRSLETLPTPPNPFYVMLDGIQDPHNLGAVLRSAEVFGADAAILAATGQTGVTSMAARSSAGAVNRVPIVRVERMEEAARALAARGVRLIGASEKASETAFACDFRQPLCLAVGNEGSGLSDAVQACCAALVRIPQYGRVGSLNAAVAAGILFYEIRRQRHAAQTTGAERMHAV